MGAVLNTVYNNYLTTYAPKTLTRFDTHKKSELRNIYNTIVKLNKESPWYLPTTSQATQQYAISIKENARELHHSIAQLGVMEDNGLFRQKSAFSSDPEIASVSYIGEPPAEGVSPSFELEVQTLASPQENLGVFLADDPVSLAPGSYSFDVAINDMNYEFQFGINEGETNRDVQKRLVRLINNADIRLNASIVEDGELAALKLTSESTGLPAGKSELFRISDDRTSKQNGTVQYFGLDYVSHEATNASFLINGEDYSSSSNHFTVGKQFDIELKGTSAEGISTHIGLKTDMETITDNVVHLISSYNDFVKSASEYLESQSRSRHLVREFSAIASQYSSSLEGMGIRLTEDGTLSVDSEALQQTAMESEDITQTFDYLKNFSGNLMRKSREVSLNPMEYVDRKVVAYKNPGHNFVSPYTTSAYSGMMFNSYC